MSREREKRRYNTCKDDASCLLGANAFPVRVKRLIFRHHYPPVVRVNNDSFLSLSFPFFACWFLAESNERASWLTLSPPPRWLCHRDFWAPQPASQQGPLYSLPHCVIRVSSSSLPRASMRGRKKERRRMDECCCKRRRWRQTKRSMWEKKE